MSLSLPIYSKSNVTKDDMLKHLKNSNISFEIEGSTIIIQNPNINAYICIYSDDEKKDNSEDSEYAQNIDGFIYTKFLFNINYFRPNFFGMYANDIIKQILTGSDLYILNEETGNHPLPYQPTGTELFEEWNTINNMSLEQLSTLAQDQDRDICDENKSMYFYKYCVNIEKLQKELTDEIYVPKLYLCKDKVSNNVVSVCIWTNNIPILLPKADFYVLTKIIQYEPTPILARVTVSYDEFNKLFEKFMNIYNYEDCHIIDSLNSNKCKDIFNAQAGNPDYNNILSNTIDVTHLITKKL